MTLQPQSVTGLVNLYAPHKNSGKTMLFSRQAWEIIFRGWLIDSGKD
jgi:hypothetical protein